jgi:hypothetical protein
MSKQSSMNSPFYWLNMCEGVAEQITDLLDAEVHRPGDVSEKFRGTIPQQDPALKSALQKVHSKLQEAHDLLTSALSSGKP